MEDWEREQKARQDDRDSRRRRSLKHRKKVEKKKAERQLHVYRPRQRTKPPKERKVVTGPAACPSCGDSDRLYAIESVVGLARGKARFETGIVHFEREGSTEIDWSVGSTTVGVACDCSWQGRLDDLVLARG